MPGPRETVLLEASAGTGKTYTIAALVERYLEHGTELDEILILTFNRNAVHELRDRMREATVMTLHAFCEYVLHDLLDEAAVLVEDRSDLQHEVIDDVYIRRYLDGGAVLAYADAVELGGVAIGDGLAHIASFDTPEGPSSTDNAAIAIAQERVAFALEVRTEFAARKRHERVMSFDDVLTRLADVLSTSTEVVELLRSRFKIVLVDEFQDTDPVQWRVLRDAFHGHATLVMVGDPKQAIYSFRGGDVTTYEVAKREVDAHYTLATNWRSDNQLIDALNGVLGGIAMGEGIAVHPVSGVHPQPRLSYAPSAAPLRLRCVERPEVQGWGIADARAAIFTDLARQIEELLSNGTTITERKDENDVERPLKASDIAVIAATVADLEQVHRTLRGAGIPSVVTAGSSVYTTPAATEWLQLLQCLEQPTYVAGLRALALTSFVGVPEAELDAEGDRVTDEVAGLVRELAQVASMRGLNAVTEVLISRGLVERVLAGDAGARHLTDLQHIGELLSGQAEPHAWLARKVQRARDDSRGDERLRRLDTDADAVQLLTIHAAKGMQWPVVFLPTLFNRYLRPIAVPRYHQNDQRYLDVSGGGDTNVGFAAHAATAAHEEAEESLRALYVALTRTKCQVTLWWAPTRDAQNGAVHRVLFGRAPGEAFVPDVVPLPYDAKAAADALARWSGHLRIEWVDGAASRQTASVVEEPRSDVSKPSEVRAFTRTIDTTWWRSSYSALTAGTHGSPVGVSAESVMKDDEEEVVVDETADDDEAAKARAVLSPMATLPAGNVFGSLVHGILENVDVEALDLRAEVATRVEEQIAQWGVEVDPAMLTEAMLAVLSSPMGVSTSPTNGVSLASIKNRDKVRELAFEVPLAGGDAARGTSPSPTLGDLAPLLRQHLPEGDPVRPYAVVLAGPDLADQSLRGYLTGSIDLAFRITTPSPSTETSATEPAYYVVDYKTNWLGPSRAPTSSTGEEAEPELTAWHYRPEALVDAMGHSDYPLQALLYIVVLHRFLTWRLPGYDPATHLGGVLYLYLRGMCGPETPIIDGQPCGVFSWKPPVALVEAISQLLDGQNSGGAHVD